jgi:hypothetical protein
VGPRDGLDECGKSRPSPGFDPRTVQPVASRYIDSAIAAGDVKRHYHTTHKNHIEEQIIKSLTECNSGTI